MRLRRRVRNSAPRLGSSWRLVVLLAAVPAPSAPAMAQARPTVAARAADPTRSRLWEGLEGGPHGVGYRHGISGSLRYHVWYPAKDQGPRTTLATYLGGGAEAYSKQLAGAGVPAAEIDSILRSPTVAVEHAPPIAGSFPVVVIGQGNAQDAADQAILAEHLASHGYVVVTTPSPMVDRPMQGESDIGPYAELQAAQMDSATHLARLVTGSTSSAVAVIGHSFGARSALLYVMQHPDVRGLVSLDGGIGTANGLDPLRRSRLFDSTRALPPILHEYETLDAFMSPDLTFLKSLRSSRLTLERRESMHHVHFTTLGFVAAMSPALARVTRSGPELQREVGEVAVSVRLFLDEVTRR